MLREIKELIGYDVHATDGIVGKVQDIYFDDAAWSIRYLLVATKNWPAKKHVVIAPAAFKEPDWNNKLFLLNIPQATVRNSPDLDAAAPIPLRYENELAHYYRWPVYWTPANEITRLSALNDKGMLTAVVEDEMADHQLVGIGEVADYTARASDGVIGKVSGFIIDDIFWDIRYIALQLGAPEKGQSALIAPGWVQDVLPEKRELSIGILKSSIVPQVTYEFRDQSGEIVSNKDLQVKIQKPWTDRKQHRQK